MNDVHCYEIIGRGLGGSVVFRARKKCSVGYIAVKSVETASEEYLLAHARVLRRLSHPHIVRFEGLDRTARHAWLLLEYCAGGALSDVLKEDRALPEKQARAFAKDIVVGLQFVHSKGLIFNGLCPANILLNEYGTLKLSSFAQCCPIPTDRESLENAQSTVHSSFDRCWRYLAPELLTDQTSVPSFSPDIWSLGVVLYEMVVGNHPFQAEDSAGLVSDIQEGNGPSLDGLSPFLADLVEKCLQKDTHQRIEWKELRCHKFWGETLPSTVTSLPDQPFITGAKSEMSESIQSVEGLAVAQPKTAPKTPPTLSKKVSEASTCGELRDHSRDLLEAQHCYERELNKKRIQPPANVNNIQKKEIPTAKWENKRKCLASIRKKAKKRPQDRPLSARSLISASSQSDHQRPQSAVHVFSDRTTANNHAHGSSAGDHMPSTESTQVTTNSGTYGEAGECSPRHTYDAQQKNVQGSQYHEQSNEDLHSEEVRAGEIIVEPTKRDISSGAVQDSAENGEPDCDVGDVNLSHSSLSLTRLTLDASELIFHSSDTNIKPIIDNPKIEKIPRPKYDARRLPFNALSAEKLAELDAGALACILGEIGRAIADKTRSQNLSSAVRTHTLNYLLNVCSSGSNELANVLVSSDLMILLFDVLKLNKSSTDLSAAILTIIGLTVRHSMQILPAFSNIGHGSMQILADFMRSGSDLVRRRAAATVGELLFFVSTWKGPFEDWNVPKFVVNMVKRCLRAGETPVCQHYAAKTVENIMAAGDCRARKWFSTHAVALALYGIFNSSKKQLLRSAALSALALILTKTPSVLRSFFDQVGVDILIPILSLEKSTLVLQLSLNILNSALGIHYAKAVSMVSNKSEFLQSLMKLFDRPGTILHAKSILTIDYLCCFDLRLLQRCAELKLMNFVDRLAREKDQYLRQCLERFSLDVRDSLESLLAEVISALEAMATQKYLNPTSLKKFKTKFQLLPLCLHVARSHALHGLLSSPKITGHIASLLEWSQRVEAEDILAVREEWMGGRSFQDIVLTLAEAVSQSSDVLQENAELFITQFLPSYLALLSSESVDTRFRALKLFSDTLIPLIRDKRVYDPSSGTGTPRGEHTVGPSHENVHEDHLQSTDDCKQQDPANPLGDPPNDRVSDMLGTAQTDVMLCTAKLNELIASKLLPTFESLLSDSVPMPQYALKLLNFLVEANPAMTRVIARWQLMPRALQYFAPDHPNNSVHNVELVDKLVRSSCSDAKALYELGLIPKLVSVFLHAHQHSISSMFPPLLSILDHLFMMEAHALSACTRAGESTGEGGFSHTVQRILARHEPLLKILPAIFDILASHTSTPDSSARYSPRDHRPEIHATVPVGLSQGDEYLCTQILQCLQSVEQLYPHYVEVVFNAERVELLSRCLAVPRKSIQLNLLNLFINLASKSVDNDNIRRKLQSSSLAEYLDITCQSHDPEITKMTIS
eukprot:950321_1